MKIEVGKSYNCGSYIVEILKEIRFADRVEYVGAINDKVNGISRVGAWYCDGQPLMQDVNTALPFPLSFNEQSPEEIFIKKNNLRPKFYENVKKIVEFLNED